MSKYYEIKVQIKDSHPLTWRRLRVPSGITFNQLAAIIELAFEWCGYHLYEFEIRQDPRKIGKFIGVPSDDDELIESLRGKKLDSKKEKIDKYFEEHKKIIFTYDFGDDWEHIITIEKEVNEKLKYPVCIKAKSGAYPEDCGGTVGYEENIDELWDEREEPDIEAINLDLEEYKEFAEEIYDKDIF